MAIKKGQDAVADLQGNGGNNSVDFTKFNDGTTLKVRVKNLTQTGIPDIATYYNYGIFNKVYSFVPEKDPTRDAKGFVVDNHNPWDLAAKYYYDKANEVKGDGSTEEEVKKLRDKGYQFLGKKKVMIGLYDLTKGKDIVIDVSPKQYNTIKNALLDYLEDDQYKDLAFKISKKGTGQSTVVTVTPVINPAKGLTDEERENFDSSLDEPFNDTLFDGVLYEADYNEQLENLVKAGFNLSLIGLKAPENAEEGTEEPAEESTGEAVDIEDDDLPF